MRTPLDLCFCLLTLCGITPELYGVRVVVDEGGDAVLPCLISTKENITGKIFYWRKDGQKEKKEVFVYDNSFHSNNGFLGQDKQFKGRVSHFQDQLKNGNASINIQNTKMADSGNYSCIFPRLQPRETFNIELVVGASKPYVTTLNKTKDWALLQCEVQGAFPKPKVEWQDSSGNILPAEEPQVSEKRSSFSVTLKTTVTKTDNYSCVVTQEELSHRIHSETFVQLNEGLSREVEHWKSTTILAAVLAAVLPLAVAVVCCRCCRLRKIRPPDCIKTVISGFCKWRMHSRDDSKMSYSHPQDIHPADATEMLMSDESPLNNGVMTPHDMKLDDDRRASENRADTEPTERRVRDPGDENEPQPEPLELSTASET